MNELLNRFEYEKQMGKIRKTPSFTEQFFAWLNLIQKTYFGNNSVEISTNEGRIYLNICWWKSNAGDNLRLIWIKNVEIKEEYQGKGLFSGFCKRIMAELDIDGIYYDTVGNEKLADALRKCSLLIKPTCNENNPKSDLTLKILKNNPTFLQLKDGLTVKDISTLHSVPGFILPVSVRRIL